jgi:hypothetical protein
MQIVISVPTKAQILAGGFTVACAGVDQEWNKSQLKDYANRKGLYVHHSNGCILYVGKTTEGRWGTFGERLRREFQEKASGNSRLHRLLRSQEMPVFSYCLDLDEVDKLVNPGPMHLRQERKALIVEQVLIGVYSPEGNEA